MHLLAGVIRLEESLGSTEAMSNIEVNSFSGITLAVRHLTWACTDVIIVFSYLPFDGCVQHSQGPHAFR